MFQKRDGKGDQSRLSCHCRKHSQTFFTTEILIKILAASTCMIDFFCKSMAATIYCDDRRSAFMFLFGAENRKANDSMSNAGSGVYSKFCQHTDLYALFIRSDIILHEYSLTAQPPVFSLKLTWKMALKDKWKKIKENVYLKSYKLKRYCAIFKRFNLCLSG